MKILKIMAILLTVVAVVSTAGCTEKVQVAGNETQKASENVTDTAVPTTSVAKSVPSVMPSVKNNTDLTSSTVVDVVCKMKIDKNTAEFKSEYKGTIYYFCSASCKKKFDENPEKYINSENKENGTQEASEQAMSATTNSMDASSTVVDPVCKMEIDKNTAEFTSVYKGTTYYFCSASCKEKFDENPSKYISS
jgi:YHS domain-containing protein